ncbi:MAG TPA: XdhC/CoxI family protein [Planctomycetota bacterium]|nr:XdhC/CoxI family protein [Planctomycetota bacterium]
MSDPLEEAVRIRRAGERGALCTVVRVSGSAPAREAMRMVVRADGSQVGTIGGGHFEEECRRAALETMRDENCRTLSFSLDPADEMEPGLVCGGDLEVFVEPLGVPRLVVLGAGHLGRAIARVAAPAGFRVTVADDRREHARLERLPGAAEAIAAPWDEAFGRLATDETSSIVIVTRSWDLDERCLRWALGTSARYVGMLGSSRKVEKVREHLLRDGVPPGAFDRLHAPVGLELGARTHEEIAVAVVAELIAVRRTGASPRPAGPSRGSARSRERASRPKAGKA